MENSDPRYVRSRHSLRQGLLELAHGDPALITVSALCEYTGVDRATFYRHFDSIDALAADTVSALAESAVREWEAKGLGKGDQFELAENVLTAFLEQVAQNWALHKWALGERGSAAAMHGVLDRFSGSVGSELRALHVSHDSVWDELTAGFVGGATLGAFLVWLQAPAPAVQPRELARWILNEAWRAWQRLELPSDHKQT